MPDDKPLVERLRAEQLTLGWSNPPTGKLGATLLEAAAELERLQAELEARQAPPAAGQASDARLIELQSIVIDNARRWRACRRSRIVAAAAASRLDASVRELEAAIAVTESRRNPRRDAGGGDKPLNVLPDFDRG